MSDAGERERQAVRTRRAEHVSGSLGRYMLLLAAGFAVFLALRADDVPVLAWDGWGVGMVICALLFGILLIWAAEHRRSG